MLKKTILGLVFAGMSAVASAELTTNVQNQTFSGEGGADSSVAGVLPLEFEKFDETLGTLTGAYISYSLDVAGGVIGADNLTNTEANGTGSLGAEALLLEESGMNFFKEGTFDSVFEKLSRVENTTFTLAADPTMSVGGSGPDVQQFNGTTGTVDSGGFISLNKSLLDQFLGAGETFTVDFDTTSVTTVSVTGAQGFFQPVNLIVGMDLYYTYEAAPTPGPADAPAPMGFAALGLALAGFGLRRKQK